MIAVGIAAYLPMKSPCAYIDMQKTTLLSGVES